MEREGKLRVRFSSAAMCVLLVLLFQWNVSQLLLDSLSVHSPQHRIAVRAVYRDQV